MKKKKKTQSRGHRSKTDNEGGGAEKETQIGNEGSGKWRKKG